MLKTTFITQLTDVDTTQKEQLGSLRFENGNWYKYVKFQNTTATVAIVADDPVAYVDNSYASHIVCGDMTDAATKPLLAGIALASIAGVAGTAYYCWIQIKGSAYTNSAIAGTPADGDKAWMSTTDKALTIGAAADDPVCAYVLDTTTHHVCLDCPF